MDTIFTDDFNNQTNSTDIGSPANAPRRAKVSGLICILFASMAASCLFVGDKDPRKFTQYFTFLLAAAVFGIFGYLVISAKSFDLPTRIVSAVSALMLIAVIVDIEWLSKGAPPMTYVIFVVVIPLLLTAISLRTGNAPVWQSLVPLLVPVITILPFYLLGRTSSDGKTAIALSDGKPAIALVPIAWAVLGAAAYLGRKARVAHTRRNAKEGPQIETQMEDMGRVK